jgi:hypothetical protein
LPLGVQVIEQLAQIWKALNYFNQPDMGAAAPLNIRRIRTVDG